MRTTNRIILIQTMLLAALNLSSCDENSTTTTLSPVGMVCNASSECITQYCNDNHYCAEKPAALLSDGSPCTKSAECISDYCNSEGVCSKKAPPNPDDKDKLGKTCSEHADCGSYFCVTNVCMKIEEVNSLTCASTDMPYCLGNYLVQCRVWSDMSYINDVTDCTKSGRVCKTANSVAICSDTCAPEDLGKEKTICDEDNKNWEGYLVGVEVHKCQKVDDNYFYVFDRYENCALNEICMNDKCF